MGLEDQVCGMGLDVKEAVGPVLLDGKVYGLG